MLAGKRILLIVTGGIAAYKTPELVRLLRKDGAAVRVVMSAAAEEFVTPLTLGAVSEDKVYRALFDLTDEAEMGHIQLSRDADLLVVAPASANVMASMAAGHAHDLATTVLLATDTPVLIAPAMNVRMWQHPATQRNLAQLIADGIAMVGPNEGDMACGEYGPGRMAEPAEIVEAVRRRLGAAPRPLQGRRAIVTAGPTHEPIDPVRYIANRSSGKQGYAIAAALANLGAETTLVSGPTALPDPAGLDVIRIESAREMLTAVETSLPADVAVFAAAVADWRTDGEATEKLKKTRGGLPRLSLVENPDILATVAAKRKHRPALVIGFAAETEDVEAHAAAKRKRKGCDWIVANDVSHDTGIMGGDENRVLLITADKTETWERMPKAQVANRLTARIAEALGPASGTK